MGEGKDRREKKEERTRKINGLLRLEGGRKGKERRERNILDKGRNINNREKGQSHLNL